VLLCNLVSIAIRVGAPRIVPTRGIPFPTGDPELAPEEERRWRRRLLERALEALGTAVEGPTVFEMATVREGSDAGAAESGSSASATATARPATSS
jgi:glycine reductase